MDWKTLLTNEAVSNYFVFGAGLFVGVLIHLIRKFIRKSVVITIEKQKEVSLVEVSSDAKDKLKITYQNEPVKDFHLTLFELRNKSDLLIENINLKLYLDEEHGKQKLYEIIIDDPLEDLRQPPPTVECVVEDKGEHYLSIKVPYLNDFKNNKDSLTIKVFSPQPILVSHLVGGGKGWMSKFFDRVAFNKKLDRITRESNSSLDLLANTAIASIMKRWR